MDAQDLRNKQEMGKDKNTPAGDNSCLCCDPRLKEQLGRPWLLLSTALFPWHVAEFGDLPCFSLVSFFCHCS